MTTFKFDLLSLKKGDTEVPQYEICYKTLCNDAMRLSCLKQHLTTVHSALANKPKNFLILKSHSLKKAKLDMCGTFQQSFLNVVEASYMICMLMGKNEKSHSIRESLVKLSMLVAVN